MAFKSNLIDLGKLPAKERERDRERGREKERGREIERKKERQTSRDREEVVCPLKVGSRYIFLEPTVEYVTHRGHTGTDTYIHAILTTSLFYCMCQSYVILLPFFDLM